MKKRNETYGAPFKILALEQFEYPSKTKERKEKQRKDSDLGPMVLL